MNLLILVCLAYGYVTLVRHGSVLTADGELDENCTEEQRMADRIGCGLIILAFLLMVFLAGADILRWLA